MNAIKKHMMEKTYNRSFHIFSCIYDLLEMVNDNYLNKKQGVQNVNYGNAQIIS